MSDQQKPLETDPRFPSGPWMGFYNYPRLPLKFKMELRLSFSGGRMVGEGLDAVGLFVIDGKYNLESGECNWTKQYIGKHSVLYRGFNESKGIWGTWEISASGKTVRGGFHIWPVGMPDPTQPTLKEEVDLPKEVEQPTNEPVLV
jgi:hypothetical protein